MKSSMIKVTRYFIKMANGEISTAYRTRAEAEADGERMANLFHDKFLRVEARETMIPRREAERA